MQKDHPPAKHSSFLKDKLTLGILGLGILLRLALAVQNRSFWMDEAMLGLNIVEKTIPQLLFQPLDYNQGAPLLFLLIEKLFTLLLGPHDWVLRLFPLIAGVLSLFIFANISSRLLNSPGKHIALLTFAVLTDFVYFSNEAKQYQVDVFVTLTLLLFMLRTLEKKKSVFSTKDVLLFAISGVCAAFLSHPAVFILGGIGVVFFVEFFVKQQPPARKINFQNLGVVAVCWAAAYLVLYLLSLDDLASNAYLVEFWHTEFMPMPPWNNWIWFPQRLTNITDPFSLVPPYQWSVVALMVAGFFILFKKQFLMGIFLTATVALAILISGFKIYPFGDRMILFLFPFVILTCTSTIQWLYELSTDRIHWAAVAFTILLSFLMLYGSLYNTTTLMLNPYITRIYNVKDLLQELDTSVNPDEPVYIYHGAIPSVLFYWKEEPINCAALIFGAAHRKDESLYNADLAQLYTYKSAWIIFSHPWPTDSGLDERFFILDILDANGTQIDEISTAEGTYAYRYQFAPADSD